MATRRKKTAIATDGMAIATDGTAEPAIAVDRTAIAQSLPASAVEGEHVEIRFLPLSFVLGSDIYWRKNAKLHALPQIVESIAEYGFIDPPKWDSNLNNGAGGLLYGNGRTKAIVASLAIAMDEGQEPPRGIPRVKATGEWCIPVKFGVDALSEEQAIAAAIDHNNLTLAGSDLSPIEQAKIWERDDYLTLLVSMRELPISVTQDDLSSLIKDAQGPSFEPATFEEQGNLDTRSPRQVREISCICPNCEHEFIRQV